MTSTSTLIFEKKLDILIGQGNYYINTKDMTIHINGYPKQELPFRGFVVNGRKGYQMFPPSFTIWMENHYLDASNRLDELANVFQKLNYHYCCIGN
jgi:hypothetical protein